MPGVPASPFRSASVATVLFLCAAAAGAPGAAPPAPVRALAATCAACHGSDGGAIEGEAMPRLAGQPREAIAASLRAFRDGSRPATVMQQLAKGYSEAEIDALAAYFAALR